MDVYRVLFPRLYLEIRPASIQITTEWYLIVCELGQTLADDYPTSLIVSLITVNCVARKKCIMQKKYIYYYSFFWLKSQQFFSFVNARKKHVENFIEIDIFNIAGTRKIFIFNTFQHTAEHRLSGR